MDSLLRKSVDLFARIGHQFFDSWGDQDLLEEVTEHVLIDLDRRQGTRLSRGLQGMTHQPVQIIRRGTGWHCEFFGETSIAEKLLQRVQELGSLLLRAIGQDMALAA